MDDEELVGIRWAFRERHFLVRPHGYIEMRLEGLTADDIRRAGSECELLEDYRGRPQGHTMLLLGLIGPNRPVHIVVNIENFERDWSERLDIVTVYVPTKPAWLDERTRARMQR